MATTALGGNPVNTSGDLPAVGESAPAFSLTGADLSTVTLGDFAGQNVVLNIFPSIDTGVCAMSVRKFNEAAATLENTTVLCVSADLPFAAGRFCGAEGIENVKTASTFRSGDFGADYGWPAPSSWCRQTARWHIRSWFQRSLKNPTTTLRSPLSPDHWRALAIAQPHTIQRTPR